MLNMWRQWSWKIQLIKLFFWLIRKTIMIWISIYFCSRIPRVNYCCFFFDMNAGGTLLSLFGILTGLMMFDWIHLSIIFITLLTGLAYLGRAFNVLYNVPRFEKELEDDDALNNNDDGIWWDLTLPFHPSKLSQHKNTFRLVYISTMFIGFFFLVVSGFMLYGSTKVRVALICRISHEHITLARCLEISRNFSRRTFCSRPKIMIFSAQVWDLKLTMDDRYQRRKIPWFFYRQQTSYTATIGYRFSAWLITFFLISSELSWAPSGQACWELLKFLTLTWASHQGILLLQVCVIKVYLKFSLKFVEFF